MYHRGQLGHVVGDFGEYWGHDVAIYSYADVESVRKRSAEVAVIHELTAQEQQIAHLVREGLSNPEIGIRLFLSPRTVEWHLRMIFVELSIKSRRQLHDALPPPLIGAAPE